LDAVDVNLGPGWSGLTSRRQQLNDSDGSRRTPELFVQEDPRVDKQKKGVAHQLWTTVPQRQCLFEGTRRSWTETNGSFSYLAVAIAGAGSPVQTGGAA